MAHAFLATLYVNLQETSLSTESMKRAYDLRDRVSEKEKFYIESHYYHFTWRKPIRSTSILHKPIRGAKDILSTWQLVTALWANMTRPSPQRSRPCVKTQRITSPTRILWPFIQT